MMRVDASTVFCKNCQSKPGFACTQPTDTGRKPVPWYHSVREQDALEAADPLTLADARSIAQNYAIDHAKSLQRFADGVKCSYERFLSDLDLVDSEIGFDAHDDTRRLRVWAMDTVLPLWTDQDRGE